MSTSTKVVSSARLSIPYNFKWGDTKVSGDVPRPVNIMKSDTGSWRWEVAVSDIDEKSLDVRLNRVDGILEIVVDPVRSFHGWQLVSMGIPQKPFVLRWMVGSRPAASIRWNVSKGLLVVELDRWSEPPPSSKWQPLAMGAPIPRESQSTPREKASLWSHWKGEYWQNLVDVLGRAGRDLPGYSLLVTVVLPRIRDVELLGEKLASLGWEMQSRWTGRAPVSGLEIQLATPAHLLRWEKLDGWIMFGNVDALVADEDGCNILRRAPGRGRDCGYIRWDLQKGSRVAGAGAREQAKD